MRGTIAQYGHRPTQSSWLTCSFFGSQISPQEVSRIRNFRWGSNDDDPEHDLGCQKKKLKKKTNAVTGEFVPDGEIIGVILALFLSISTVIIFLVRQSDIVEVSKKAQSSKCFY